MRRPRVVECLLTLRRVYEVERSEGRRSPRRPFALSPRAGTPDVSGHQPLRLAQRHSSPFTPDINYQAVQQVHHSSARSTGSTGPGVPYPGTAAAGITVSACRDRDEQPEVQVWDGERSGVAY